jgi:4-hydroxy-3-polyprenylbenzoate decarboxylase
MASPEGKPGRTGGDVVKNLVLAITGASGVIYAQRLLEFLVQKELKIHLIVSNNAANVLQEELYIEPGTLAELSDEKIVLYSNTDFAAAPASGTSRMDAMVVVPCSMGTLGAIAHGLSRNLIHRAASVALKEKRPLVLVPRETPLGAVSLENMLKLANLGVSMIPAMPAFYHHPKSVNDLVDFVVTRILDHLGIESDLIQRWE